MERKSIKRRNIKGRECKKKKYEEKECREKKYKGRESVEGDLYSGLPKNVAFYNKILCNISRCYVSSAN